MKNYISTGDKIDFVPQTDVKSGDAIMVGDVFAVAGADTAAGMTGSANIRGVYDLTKQDSEVITQGKAAYFDNTNDRVTATATNNVKIGFFQAGAVAGSSVVQVNIYPQV